jgi:hypothetical protein
VFAFQLKVMEKDPLFQQFRLRKSYRSLTLVGRYLAYASIVILFSSYGQESLAKVSLMTRVCNFFLGSKKINPQVNPTVELEKFDDSGDQKNLLLSHQDYLKFWANRSLLSEERLNSLAKDIQSNGNLIRGMRVTPERLMDIISHGMKIKKSVYGELSFGTNPKTAVAFSLMGGEIPEWADADPNAPKGAYFAVVLELLNSSSHSNEWVIKVKDDIPADDIGRVWIFNKVTDKFEFLNPEML